MSIIQPNFLASAASVFGTVWPYVVAVLLFLMMIIIHEFGHFIFAKMLGVRVNEFSVGFGPTLFKHQGKETLYSVRLIPFGGYCAMEGEDESSNDSRAFCNKAAWRRFLIVAAGAIFNIIFGFVLVLIYFAPAGAIATNTVASFSKDATSVNYGLKEGDEILAVDGRRCLTANEIAYAFSAVKDNKIDLTVKRNGEKQLLKNVEFKLTEQDGIRYLTRDFDFYYAKNNFKTYISQSFKYTVSFGRTVWFSLVDLIGGRYSLNQVSGPVGVASALGQATKIGLDSLLPMLCLITINLGIFNLLPIPALDGGRLVFLLFEMIARKPVPQKYEAIVHGVGFIILMGFVALVTLKDIIGFF